MEESQRITRKSASNLALAFILLPRAKREGMSALYAFCREVDDIADEDSVPVDVRRARLAEWREDLRRACGTEQPRLQVNRELQTVIHRYKLSSAHFEDLLRGVEMDLDTRRYSDFADLELYCYRVASVVGLLSIEIFGYQDPACREYAVYLGKALQLTNILRDVGGDATRRRIYLPARELERFKVSEDEILHGTYSDRFLALAESMAQRARGFFRLARETLPASDRRAMAAAELMGAVYWRLLRKLERSGFQVLGRAPVRLSKGHKLILIARTWLLIASRAKRPSYGN
jgi:15-cis-phytoene synthase